MPVAESVFSQEAQRRLRKPPRRGMFETIDAARAQLALLSVCDDLGQIRIYWLIDLATQRIEDARYLSFGDLTSHPIGDAFTELVRGKTLSEAGQLEAAEVEARLRDEPEHPAFGAAGLAPFAFLRQIQDRALAESPNLRLLPKPVEVQRYERKRQQDWDEEDRAWLPLSLLKKIAKVQNVLGTVVNARLGRPEIGYSVEGLHEDFQLRISLSGVSEEEVATVLQFFQSELQDSIHPHIRVEEAT